jgi:hypothetical protein
VINVELILSTFLRSQPEVVALVEDRIYTDLPHDRVYPLVVFSRIGGGYTTNQPFWLESAEIALEAYGGTHKQAQEIASVCLDVMAARLRGRYPEGSVTGITQTALAYDPESDLLDDTGHSRPRYLLTANVIAHP